MNDEQLTSDIKRAFGRFHAAPRPIGSLAADSTAVVPAPVAAGRPGFLTRRRLLGGLSFAGVAAAVVMAFALTLEIGPGTAGPESVYAGWQAIPTQNDAAMRSAARSQCLGGFLSGDAPLLVQDQRGAVAMFVFGASNEYLACVLIPDGKAGYRAEMAGVSDGVHSPLSQHFGWSVSSGPASDLPPEVTMFGTTDASKVVIRRADGTEVVASVAQGIFLAWWPGCTQPAALMAYDGDLEIASREMNPGDTSLTCRA